MFGTYRFILAQLVLFGHVLGPTFHYNDAAVLDFFMLSGFVMTALIRKSYPQLGRPTLYFYLDRLLRIVPQYLLFLTLTLICMQLFSFTFYGIHFSAPPTPWLIFLNYLIVPLNYRYFYPPLEKFLLVPPAWSLGLEEQFYWFFPLFVLNRHLGRAIIIASLVVYGFAFTGAINPEFFGYRTLPGVLFIFMLGKSLADYNFTHKKEDLWTMLGLYGFVVLLLVTVLIKADLQANYRLEVLTAVAVGFPLLAFLSRMKRRQFDELLGHTSYGIFLSQFLVLNLLTHFQLFSNNRDELVWAAALGSTIFGYAGYVLVEKFINPLRMRLRERANPKVETVATGSRRQRRGHHYRRDTF